LKTSGYLLISPVEYAPRDQERSAFERKAVELVEEFCNCEGDDQRRQVTPPEPKYTLDPTDNLDHTSLLNAFSPVTQCTCKPCGVLVAARHK
jgi:hypothetical protein